MEAMIFVNLTFESKKTNLLYRREGVMFEVMPIKFREKSLWEIIKTENQTADIGKIAAEDPIFFQVIARCAGVRRVILEDAKRAAAEITEDLNKELSSHGSRLLSERGIALVVVERIPMQEGPLGF
jgi:hypothetical protein